MRCGPTCGIYDRICTNIPSLASRSGAPAPLLPSIFDHPGSTRLSRASEVLASSQHCGETRVGPLMSAEDNFEIILRGLGGHAARPQQTREVLVAACTLVVNLQMIVARRLNPTDISVVSVTEILTDGTRNALPGTARILGDARSFPPSVRAP